MFSLPKQLKKSFLVCWIFGLALSPILVNAQSYIVVTVGTDGNCDKSNLKDALDETANNPGEDYIFVSGSPTDVAVTVDNQDVDIVGGFADCSAPSPTPGVRTVVSGNSAQSIITVLNNAHVNLNNFQLSFGISTGDGGAIAYLGNGELSLTNVRIDNNNAVNGGGIAVEPPPSSSAVVHLVNTSIDTNKASKGGGGIRLTGNTTLYSDALSVINSNKALNGGGIALDAPSEVFISSNMDNNQASENGGAIAAYAANASAAVNLYTSDTNQPVSIYQNSANHGGGVYFSSVSPYLLTLCAQEFSMDNNTATDGAAIYGEGANGLIQLNSAGCGPANDAQYTYPQAPCAPDTLGCNEFRSDVTPVDSVITLVGNLQTMQVNRVAMRDNSGKSLISIALPDTDGTPINVLKMSNCLLVDNPRLENVLNLTSTAAYVGGTAVSIDGCTIANNTLSGSSVFVHQVNYLTLINSIVEQQPPLEILRNDETPAGDIEVQYDLVSSFTNLGDTLHVSTDAPTFVDSVSTGAGDHNFHLLGNLGVDFAPASTSGDYDLDGVARPTALPCSHHAVYGTLDLGAYESAGDPDNIFCSELGD